MTVQRWLVLALALSAVSACGSRKDQRTDTINPAQAMKRFESLPPAFKAELDSGNASFRDKDYQAALAHYQAATKIDEGVVAGWFGVYMAQHALGNEAEAQKAMERVRKLAPDASLLHSLGGDTAR